MSFRPRAHAIVALAVLAAAACSGDSAADSIAITASDDACAVATTDLPAGKTTFAVQNDGSKVTEVYVYAPEDRVVTERENIGPGTSVNFTVDLAAGDYEIACKPGQVGDGIRQPITVSGEGGSALLTEYDVEAEFTAIDYDYEGIGGVTFDAGDAVEFVMVNEGTVAHEFEVFDPDGEVLGEIGPTPFGQTGTVILALEQPGTYRFVCGLEGHEELGMYGSFEVA